MFNKFITALVHKIFQFLTNHPDLFEKEGKKRAEMLDGLQLSAQFKEYLAEISEKEFMEEMEIALKFSLNTEGLNLRKNKFFTQVVAFITQALAFKMDMIENDFYLKNAEARKDIAEKLIAGESEAAQSMREILVNYSYQQIANELYRLANKIEETPLILVQIPKEAEPEFKKNVRKYFVEKYPLSFPTFQTNSKLIGGIRIFVNGETEDHSWLSRVLRFASQTSV